MRLIRWPPRIVWRMLVLSAVAPVCFTGCGDGKLRRGAVSGIVKIDGKPAAGAVVTLCAVGGAEELQKLRPTGVTATDGRYQLGTFDTADGAPIGNYKALIQWPSPTGGDPRSGGPGPDRLRGKYNRFDTSQFSVDVKAGANDVPPFELKSR